MSRNVFLCYVCGAAGSGKTSLLRAFLKKPFSEIYEPTSKMMTAVNAVDIEGSEKYLVVSTYVYVFFFSHALSSYKNSAPNTRRRLCETQRRRTWQMLSSTCMIPATQTRFLTSVIYGYCSPIRGVSHSAHSPYSSNTASIIYQPYLLQLNLIWTLRNRFVVLFSNPSLSIDEHDTAT